MPWRSAPAPPQAPLAGSWRHHTRGGGGLTRSGSPLVADSAAFIPPGKPVLSDDEYNALRLQLKKDGSSVSTYYILSSTPVHTQYTVRKATRRSPQLVEIAEELGFPRRNNLRAAVAHHPRCRSSPSPTQTLLPFPGGHARRTPVRRGLRRVQDGHARGQGQDAPALPAGLGAHAR